MLKTAIRSLTELMEFVAAITLAMMLLHVLADVVGRQVIGMPAPATTEVVAYYYMIAAVFLPLPFVELRNRAISVDLFYNTFPHWMKRFSIIIAALCGIVFWGILAVKSSYDAIDAFQKGEMIDGTYTVPIWPTRCALPIAFGLTTMVVALRLVEQGLLGLPESEDEASEAV